jgi:hypothetical protein
MRGNGPVVMAGGSGSNTYELLDGASASEVVQLPGRGTDTVISDHSITAPENIEIVRATPNANRDRGVTLRGIEPGQSLIGSNGNDTLISGPDGYLSGRRGNNTLILSPFDFTEARGGPGKNRFVILAQPAVDPSLWIGMRLSNAPVAQKSADVVDDLHRGDRLVLSTKSFGPALGRLRGHMRVTVGGGSRGRGPQFVFTPSRGLLQFDADGQGGSPPVVVAILKGYRKPPTWAIQIV